ncbi:MAG: outer membrane protein assembly factor BamE [Xanthomonadales bacterium]|nr:outer membrane protein assembly factor BamE [Xanthomonadales bacterium]
MATRQIFITMLLLTLVAATTGCNFIYKIDIQQGTMLDQDMVNDLKPGMTKRQVALVLGTPAIASPFHQDRWDYIQTYERRGEQITRKVLSLAFENNRLVKIEGDYMPEESELADSSASE